VRYIKYNDERNDDMWIISTSSNGGGNMTEVETRTMKKVMWRLPPFLITCYCFSFPDRVNVGFAALEMNTALGLSSAAFGLGAGLFFLPYFVLEVPSNIALEKFGARFWIARIMITWGLISGSFAFIGPIAHALGRSNEVVFYALRFLLGAAEAGFFPGIIFFLTLWFPSAYRARVMSVFMLAIPLSSILGAPISGLLVGVPPA
jgi:ACS family tartrate transporter-like MFS transporter